MNFPDFERITPEVTGDAVLEALNSTKQALRAGALVTIYPRRHWHKQCEQMGSHAGQADAVQRRASYQIQELDGAALRSLP